MSGFCGWVGLEASPEPGRHDLERMARWLNRFDGTVVDEFVDRSVAVASASLTGRPALARHADLVAVLEGEPRFADADLDAEARRRGAAAAMLLGYRKHGAEIVVRMRGDFSAAVLRTDGTGAMLAIDRVGGRCPLYYRRVVGGLIFATNGHALQQHPRGRSELDTQALYNYLYFHMVPAPRTARRDVSRLLPGHRLLWHGDSVAVAPYWTIEYTETSAAPLSALEQEFRDILRESVERAGGRPGTGCFLSGGTDSSTVAGMLCRVSGRPAPTFSIGFDSKRYDEMKYARIAASHFGTEHHEYYLEPADVVALIPRVAEIYSEPFGNESVVPAYHCARMANELGIRVLLGGDGGDELFAGNERYATQKIFDLYRRVPSPLRRGLLEPVVTHFPAGGSIWPVRKARGYIAKARMRMPDRTQIYNYMERFGADTVFQPDFLAEVDVDEPRRLLRESYDGVRADSMLNRCLAMDLRFTLADNDLPKVSRMAELEGVRVCYPLLDDELIDFAARLPPELKLRRLELRWFFKHALRDFLPEEIIRKTKHGMGMPFGLWLETYAPLQELVRDSLDALKRRDIVRPAFVDQVSEMHRNEHAVYYGVMIWLLVQLEQWLRCHDDGSGV